MTENTHTQKEATSNRLEEVTNKRYDQFHKGVQFQWCDFQTPEFRFHLYLSSVFIFFSLCLLQLPSWCERRNGESSLTPLLSGMAASSEAMRLSISQK